MTSRTRSLYYTLGYMQSVAAWTVAIPIVIALLIRGILAVVIAKLVLMFLVSGEQVCVCVHVCVCVCVRVCVCMRMCVVRMEDECILYPGMFWCVLHTYICTDLCCIGLS